MEYSAADLEAGVWAGAARVAGAEIDPRGDYSGSVERVRDALPDVTERIATALSNEDAEPWHPAGTRFAAEILASAMLIRIIRDENPSDILADSGARLPDWIRIIINDW